MIINFVKYYFSSFSRKLYWFIRLSKIKFGNNPNLSFPLKIEGKGNIEIGDKARLGRMVNLGVGENSKLIVQNECHLESESTILLMKDCILNVGDSFKLGKGSRLFVKNNWSFGNGVRIETNCSIFSREPDKFGVLSIGNGSHIGDYTIIDVVDNVTIGNEVAIGPNCTIYSHDHIYTNKDLPSWKGGLQSDSVIIKDGAWVGANVTVLPGVVIGERAIIASGAVVTKSVKSNALYGGIPAKWIKDIV